MWFRRKPKREPPPLLQLTPDDAITLHQACEGILVTGGTGSGKTTGPGDHLARGLLRAGCGGLVLTAKPDEWRRWERLGQQTGRQILRMVPGGEYRMDVLREEMSHGTASVEAGAQLLSVLFNLASREAGKGDDPFWQQFAERVGKHCIYPPFLAYGTASITDLYRVITSAPNESDQVASEQWKEGSYLAKCLLDARERLGDHHRDLNLSADFWLKEWPELSDKTRSIGYTMTTNVLDKFLSGTVTDMVSSGESTLHASDILNGAIVVVDMPVLSWGLPAQFVQTAIKVVIQKAALRREIAPESKPVFIWADEAQFFCSPETDAQVMTVARSQQLIHVSLTQNLPNLITAMGGAEKGRHLTEGWIANYMTKIACANACKETNKFFSELLGESLQLTSDITPSAEPYELVADYMGTRRDGTQIHFKQGWRHEVEPSEWLRLAKGGPSNDMTVEAIAFQGGKIWSNGKTWVKARFRQMV